MLRRLSLVLLCLLLCLPLAARGEETLSLFAVNVRKADCLLLRSGEDVYMIDTGSAESWGQVSAALHSLGITRLKGVILTHTDDDHAGGLMALASSSIVIDGWYASAWYADVKTSKHPMRLAAALRAEEVTWLRSGDELPLEGGSLTVLGPMRESETENCNSVVLLAKGGGGSILLTGDMEFDEENDLLSAGLITPCTVLKVANHGESDATSSALVQAAQPRIAVISTNSDDEKDTPATRVLKALKKVDAQIAVTQNAQAGVLVELTGGAASVQLSAWPQWPEKQTGVVVSGKSIPDQTVTVTNQGSAEADLSGCFLYSERGGETFVFPDGTVLAAGQSLTVAAHGSTAAADLTWGESKVWHKSKADAAVLYDAYGRELSRLD